MKRKYKHKSVKQKLADYRKKRAKLGWKYYSVQVPASIKKQLQKYKRELMQKYKGC